jgi:hypothetical protein
MPLPTLPFAMDAAGRQAAIVVQSEPIRAPVPPRTLFLRPQTVERWEGRLQAPDLRYEDGLATSDLAWTYRDPYLRLAGFGLRGSYSRAILEADALEGEAGSYRVQAQKVRFGPQAVLADGVRAEGRVGPVTVVRVRAQTLRVEPHRSRAEGVDIELLGVSVLSLRDLPLKLEPTETSGRNLEVPRPARFDLGGGLGLSDGRLNYDVSVLYSLIPTTEAPGAGLDGPNVRESFMGSFYSNVRQPLLDRYLERFRAPRLAVVGFRDVGKRVRNFDEVVRLDRPYGLGVELGGPLGPFGYRMQVRRERYESEFAASERWVGLLSVAFLQEEILRGLTWDVRAEAMAVDGYAWVRPMVGLAAWVSPDLRLGAAYHFTSHARAEPEFEFDAVIPGSELHVRAETFLGRTTLAFVNRYRADEGRWYRPQYMIEHPVGMFMPWLKYDGQFRSVAFGFRVRTDAIERALRPRKLERSDSE